MISAVHTVGALGRLYSLSDILMVLHLCYGGPKSWYSCGKRALPNIQSPKSARSRSTAFFFSAAEAYAVCYGCAVCKLGELHLQREKLHTCGAFVNDTCAR